MGLELAQLYFVLNDRAHSQYADHASPALRSALSIEHMGSLAYLRRLMRTMNKDDERGLNQDYESG